MSVCRFCGLRYLVYRSAAGLLAQPQSGTRSVPSRDEAAAAGRSAQAAARGGKLAPEVVLQGLVGEGTEARLQQCGHTRLALREGRAKCPGGSPPPHASAFQSHGSYPDDFA